MTFQYMIWVNDKGERDHLAFNQKSGRVVYPPSNVFYRKPIAVAIRAYEMGGYEMEDTGAWKGDMLNEYIRAMQAMHPEVLSEGATTEGEKLRLSQKDSPKDRVESTRESTRPEPSGSGRDPV
jgi:hypothetical protein